MPMLMAVFVPRARLSRAACALCSTPLSLLASRKLLVVVTLVTVAAVVLEVVGILTMIYIITAIFRLVVHTSTSM
eukprot:6206525-Pleurochrysis_carterae.AAC.1